MCRGCDDTGWVPCPACDGETVLEAGTPEERQCSVCEDLNGFLPCPDCGDEDDA